MHCNGDPARIGFLMKPDGSFKLSGTCAYQPEVFGTMVGAYGPYNFGGSVIGGIRV